MALRAEKGERWVEVHIPLGSSGDGLRAIWCLADLATAMEIPVLLCLTQTFHPRVATGP